MINAFYFGEQSKPLLGIHLIANQNNDKGESIVICAPIGHEYSRCHNSLKLLANELAHCGFSVLRFNYYATGDSSGDSSQGDLTQWVEDIGNAIQEAKDLSGSNKVSLIGLRTGALLALEASKQQPVNRLILWEPLLSGKTYLEQLKKMHQFAITDPERFYLTEDSITETENQFLGHFYSTTLQNQLANLKIEEPLNYQVNDLMVVTSEHDDEKIADQYQSITNKPIIKIHSTTNWRDSRQIGKMFIAGHSLSMLCGIMKGD